ncbi:MAG: ArdC-like ssDNA-binding domain-containing protein [Bdellovibrionota bacterium]
MSGKVYEIITDRIIEQLEKGVAPWRKPWNAEQGFPRNLVTGKPYRGVNVFLLHAAGFESPYFLTFKQARQLGGHVRKGERGLPVIFWNWIEKESRERPGEIETIPFLRYYTVFNVSQCEGVQAPQENRARTHEPIRACEEIAKGYRNGPEVIHGKTQAAYHPYFDMVFMPSPEAFTTGEEYYGTLFHELTHSTGHESRLARQSFNETASFGSYSYSKEELVAEMGAAFLCGMAGISPAVIRNQAAYLKNWIDALRGDSRLAIQAAAQAQKAADLILGIEARKEPEEEGEGRGSPGPVLERMPLRSTSPSLFS